MDTVVGDNVYDYSIDGSYGDYDYDGTLHGDYSYDGSSFGAYDYDDFFDGGFFIAWFMAFFAIIAVVGLVIGVFKIICNWKIFTKAGQEGWKAIIPIYNTWTLCEIVGLEGWYSLLQLIPGIGVIAALVLKIVLSIRLSKCFGKSEGYAVGLIFLDLIFSAILAFDKSEFRNYSSEQQVAN